MDTIYGPAHEHFINLISYVDIHTYDEYTFAAEVIPILGHIIDLMKDQSDHEIKIQDVPSELPSL